MVTLKGFKKMQGVSKKSGNKYDGYIVYCEESVVPDDMKGCICFEKFINTSNLSGELYLGATLLFHYDHKGYLQTVEVV